MMNKKLFIFTLTIFILSSCGIPATSVPEPTNTTPHTATDLPLPTATSFPGRTPQPTNPYGIKNTLDKSSALLNGYILYGNISWTDPVIPSYGASAFLVGIKDATGKEIPFENADVQDSNGNVIPFEGAKSGIYPDPDNKQRQDWAYKISSGNFYMPLSLSFVVTASLPVDEGSFTFDPGSNPQLGQKWDINQDVMVNNETIHILSVEEAGIEEGYFLFTMQSDSNLIGAAITDPAHPPVGGGGGGGGIPVLGESFQSGFSYQMPLPQGPYTLTFTNVVLVVQGDWTLTWAPSATLQVETQIEYRNSDLGFSFSLPSSWEGFTVQNIEWEGLKSGDLGDEVVQRGPLISIVHPKSSVQQPRQNIPIMVFTIDQWDQLQQGEWHVGAAPIGPSELGRSSKQVFALPARYNYALLEGWEEVEQILQSHPLATFEPGVSP